MPNPSPPPFHEQLKSALAGLEIAPRLEAHGLSTATFYRVLRGVYAPRWDVVLGLVRAFELEISITPAGLSVRPWARQPEPAHATVDPS